MAIIFKDTRIAGTGTPGRPGLSAYEIAKEYGYKGTEEEFATNLINASNVQEYLANHNIDESAHPYILQLIDENTDAIKTLREVATNKADATTVSTHTSNTSNPHDVTAAQVGAPTIEEMNATIAAAIGAAIGDSY